MAKSEEGKEGKEDSQEERSNRSTKPLSIRIASEVRYALCSTDRPQLSPTEYPRNNSQAGPLCRWLLHNGPAC
jgi:hypothetical protein